MILSPTILDRFCRLVFNQMCDDAEFALETLVFCLLTIPHTHTHPEPFCKIIFHKVQKGWSELQGHSLASLHWKRSERRALCLMLHLKCAVSSVCISLMLYEVIIYAIWNAVDLYIENMNLTNRRLFSISNACLCRLLALAAVRVSGLMYLRLIKV